MQNKSLTGFLPTAHRHDVPLHAHLVAITEAGPFRALAYVLSGHLPRHIAFLVVDSHESNRGRISLSFFCYLK